MNRHRMGIDPVAGHGREVLLLEVVVHHHARVRVLAQAKLGLALLTNVEIAEKVNFSF